MLRGTSPYIFLHNKIIPSEEAQIHIASHTVQYGSSVFGGIRGYLYDGVAHLFRLQDHWERLTSGVRTLGWDYPIEWEFFSDTIQELVKANAPKSDFYIRPMIYCPDQEVSPHYIDLSFDLAIYLLPLSHYFDPNRGVRLMTSHWTKFSDHSLPTKAKAGGCYINSAVAGTDARRAGFDDALMLDPNGFVAEASAANTLLSYQGEILCPPLGSAALNGITLRTLLELLEYEKIPYSRTIIDRSMVYTGDELLLTGTAAEVSYVKSVDHRRLKYGTEGPGPLCERLRALFRSTIKGNHPLSEQWITAISLT